jgi:uncharacterized protein
MASVSPHPFSLLVKPAGADCNLNCGYCFYLTKAGLYPEVTQPRMSIATVERMLRAYYAIPMPVYAFGWQGGEPTLMGTDFFREVFALQRALTPRGSTTTNGLQTNGTLLTPEWAQLLREHDVLVGISIDGPAELHNRRRRWADRNGAAISGIEGDTHARVAAAVRLLREERVAHNALTVVGAHNVHAPNEIYDYLRSLRIRHMQFIPLVEWDGAAAVVPERGASLTDYSVSGDAWGRFLTAIFDRWFPRDVRRVSIRHHDSILELLVHGHYNVCTMGDACGGHLVVEHNGDIYPCDFYVERDLRLGSIGTDGGFETHDGFATEGGRGTKGGFATHGAEVEPDRNNPFVAALSSPVSRTFAAQKAHRNSACATCAYRRLCGGDCPKMRAPSSDGTSPDGRGLSALCSGWTAFYDHTLNDFLRLSRSVTDHPRVGARELMNG